MADTPKHSVSVAGIVIDDCDRVLIIQRRDNGHWEPPGGVLELSETFETGTIREVREETGIDVSVVALSGIYKNMTGGIVSIVFRCTPKCGETATSSETKSVKWESASDATKRMDPAFGVRISDAFLEGVQVRFHDGVTVLNL